MKKKRVLFIAPSSYPVNGAEAIVNIKLLKALSDDGGFVIDLVSKKRKWVDYPSSSLDDYGVLLESISTIEVDNKVTFRSLFQTFMCVCKFGIYYTGCHWAFPAKSVIDDLVSKNHYDYVITKDTPSFILGDYCHKKYNMKWVATWNDPFPACKYPYPYGQGKDAKQSYWIKKVIRIMEHADYHIFPSNRLQNYMLSYIHVSKDRCFVIPHIVLACKQHQYEHGTALRLVHTGKLAAPRNPRSFILALKDFLSKNIDKKIVFDIIGGVDGQLKQFIEDEGVSDIVRLKSPVEYNTSIELLSNYDAAVIIEADCEEGIFLPTKVSDFMQVGIPIFSLSPQNGVLNDLYKGGYIGYFSCVSDREAIVKEIELLYDDFMNDILPGKACVNPDFLAPTVLEKYYLF